MAGSRSLRIYGQDVAIRAEVVALQAASAHADADELIAWLRSAAEQPQQVFLTHGDPDAADALRRRIDHELGWAACVPQQLDRTWLERAAAGVPLPQPQPPPIA